MQQSLAPFGDPAVKNDTRMYDNCMLLRIQLFFMSFSVKISSAVDLVHILVSISDTVTVCKSIRILIKVEIHSP